jgi:hypothetical protein
MGRLLVTVAAERRCDPLALLDEPLWRTLYHFHHLAERDARDALHKRQARVDLGMMVAHAFNQPSSLDDEMRDVRQALADLDREPTEGASVWDAARGKGEEMAARIERGRVLSPEALLS